MDEIESLFKSAAENYNRGRPHLDICHKLTAACLRKLHRDARFERYSVHRAHNLETEYWVFKSDGSVSRAIARHLFVEDEGEYLKLEADGIGRLARGDALAAEDVEVIDKFIYTAIMAFAAAYDLWKPGSRKTPGTLFEVIMAALMSLHFPKSPQSKHVNLGALLGADVEREDAEGREDTGDEDEEESSVSTDLVISSDRNKKAAVIPLKITTRERVVQPFAHQRILQSSFPDKYHSFLCCISETQLDKKTKTVKQICVPGTIKLFQRFLAQIEGLYYCDIPARYSQPNFTRVVPVKRLSEVFNDVRKLLSA